MVFKSGLMGTPNREPQEYSRNIMEYKDPGRYIWGSLFGVPSKLLSVLVGNPKCIRYMAVAYGHRGSR